VHGLLEYAVMATPISDIVRFKSYIKFHIGSLYAVVRPSVSLRLFQSLSVTLVHPTQPVEIFCNFSTQFVPLPSTNIDGKFYGDSPRRIPPSGELNARGVALQV